MSMEEQQILRVGYAIPLKKESSVIRPSLLDHAASRGVRFIRIDPAVPLSEQHRSQEGPFHCIVHKLYGEDWKIQIQLFSLDYPDVPIIDSPDCIEPLHNRVTMLQMVHQLSIQGHEAVSFGVPKQVVVHDPDELKLGRLREDVRFPVIAKPLMVDGSLGSHKMHVVFTPKGLEKLRAPVALQEFVNHGGVIFKVYVVGETVQCVKRRSLPDTVISKYEHHEDPMPFSQISGTAPAVGMEMEMPPVSFVSDLAGELRRVMGLNLFNFDLIKDGRYEGEGERYLVIDINYCPGFAKMPGYETILTEFFRDLIMKRRQ